MAVAGEKEQLFETAPYLHAEFSHLTWFGFPGSGKPGAVFYVDNVGWNEAEGFGLLRASQLFIVTRPAARRKL
ncbi:MAG: hypothetical protein FJ388_12405 [Verrucomicrobia bacterium]|nr:hypothetical protein [Verrucomicrobiota bacterium]